MHKKAIFSISYLIIGLFIGVFSFSVLSSIKAPDKADVRFVKACGQLNGKELTLAKYCCPTGKLLYRWIF